MSRLRATVTSIVILVLTVGMSAGPREHHPTVPGGVEVTPKGEIIEVVAGATNQSAIFQVKNTKTTAATYSLSCSGSGAVTCIDFEPISVGLDPQETANVFATFNVGVGSSGTLTLAASGPASDAGWYDVSVTSPPNPIIAFRNFNTDNRDRGLCLTSGAGEAAAWQCGDLLVSHGMPAYATLGRDRSITLVYTSAQAAPRIVAPVAVTHGGMLPNSVYSDLWIDKGAGMVYSGSYGNWYAWMAGTRQIVLNGNADSLPTGAYRIAVYVADLFTGVNTSATVYDTVPIVNRRKSRFGRGWSLAGVEELVFNQPVGTGLGWIVWSGGEGSAKLYRKLNATTWVAPAGAYRDTLVYDGVAKTYTRSLRHGIKVVFDSLGRHQQTINRTGHATQFFWSGSPARLDSIKVPPAGRPRTTYKFVYDAAGMIDSIIDPAGRGLNLTVASDSTLTSARDPVASLVTSFQYDAQGRMTRRTSPRGFNTRYEYANGLRVTRVSEPYGNNTPLDTARTQFVAWDERGLSLGATYQTAVDTGSAFTVIRGPRYPAVPDTARFDVDRWGAPTRAMNSMGHTTTYTRSDAASPALITRLTYPNGRVVKLSWNGRGNLLSQTDSTDRGQSTSSWEYNDVNTADSPSRVLDPLSRATRFWYDSLGLTDSVMDPRGHRTRFWKRASAGFKFSTGIKGTVDSAAERDVNTWWQSDSTDHVTDQVTRFTYDTVGNLRTTTSPTGIMTIYARDSVERVKDVYTPDGKRSERVYDAMNRVLESRTYTTNQANPFGLNPLQNCDINQILCVDSTKTWDGFASVLTTRYVHGPAGVDSVVDPRGVPRAFLYDASGRARRELNDYNQARQVFYNAAGLADSTISRSNITVKYQYDQLGRLTKTIYPARAGGVGGPGGSVPGDTLTYTYDVMGNMLTAQNRHGTITRSYYLDGLLKQKITAIAGFTATFDYRYSAANELVTSIRGQDSVFYRYNAATGALDSLAVWWASPANTRRVFAFTWDSLGRRHKILYPTGTSPASSMTVTYRYDGNGQLRRVVSSHPGGSATGDAFDFTFRNQVVDPMGRVLFQKLTCDNGTYPNGGNPCGNSSSIAHENSYNALSHLVRQVVGGSSDSMRYDASGNMIARRRQSSPYTKLFTIPAGHNRMTGTTCTPNGCNPKGHTYTADGDREHDDPTPNDASDRWYYYDGLGRMAGYQTFDPQTGSQIDHHDSCGYDPDGNMARSCENFAAWLAYDGSNVATELVAGDQGWHFVSGPGVDDPLIGYFRGSTSSRILYWVTDGQGRHFAVADSNGGLLPSDGYVDHQNYRFAGTTKSGSTFGASRLEPQGAAGSGLSFFRNRAYDQNTGRWTQEDPIGLAGGVNLYQFNGNNPVAYTDPFGLCPKDKGGDGKTESIDDCPKGSAGWKENEAKKKEAADSAKAARSKAAEEAVRQAYAACGRAAHERLQTSYDALQPATSEDIIGGAVVIAVVRSLGGGPPAMAAGAGAVYRRQLGALAKIAGMGPALVDACLKAREQVSALAP